MNRRQLREVVLCLFYAWEISGEESFSALREMQDALPASKISEKAEKRIQAMLALYLEHETEINQCIQAYSKDWDIGRIAKMDLSILRIALVELFYCPGVPMKVSLNEAVELAKKYATDQSPKFINGILAAIVRAHPEWEEAEKSQEAAESCVL